jgi:hypothetical protein
VGRWYDDFRQLDDATVIDLLHRSAAVRPCPDVRLPAPHSLSVALQLL